MIKVGDRVALKEDHPSGNYDLRAKDEGTVLGRGKGFGGYWIRFE